MKAHEILDKAAQHMKDRAAQYDKPEGERSMEATVRAFNAVTGQQLTTEQGWLFQIILKAVRSQQNGYRPDNYEDLVAYGALLGEQAAEDRDPRNLPAPIEELAPEAENVSARGSTFHKTQPPLPLWRQWRGEFEVPPQLRSLEDRVVVKFPSGSESAGTAGSFFWGHGASTVDSQRIFAWRFYNDDE